MGPKARRGRSAKRGRPPKQRQRAAVVNLDGASSSENECVTPVKPRAETRRKPEHIMHITLSPDKMSRGIMSDSSDSDSRSDCTAAPEPPAPRVPCLNIIGSDNSDDIFDINYSAHNHQALLGAYKELIVKEGELKKTLPVAKEDHLPAPGDSDDECYIEEPAFSTPKRKEEISPPSPTLFEIDKQVQREESHQNTRKRRRRKNKEDKAVVQREMSKKQRISINESLNLSSDVVISENEDEDVNPEIRVCIKWGRESFRLPIRKLQKFSHLYEVLAQKYGVSEDRVVLNLKDKIINPALSPGDLGVTIADVIEGGIGSLESSTREQPPVQQTIPRDPDSVSLRIQNSKKGSVHISIGLKEKMSVLMHKYAEEKQHKVDRLRFMFDGEQLKPHSTPSSLDLEGGECIDVYELT